MKIAIYAIAKNEEHFIERWGNSAAEADHLLILDTGSTDRTVQYAEELSIDVRVAHFVPWRFDTARNAALEMLPEDIDLCVSLDLDEVLLPGWREALESLPSGVTRPRYKYVWSWNDDGTEGLVYSRDHIHTRHGYTWRHPVHEVLVTQPGVDEVEHWCDLVVHHYPDSTKSRAQYGPLLNLATEEDPADDRLAFYYGRELVYNGQFDAAAQELERYLALPTAVWGAERSAAMRLLADCRPDEGERWLLKAAGEAIDRRESWVALARYYHDHHQWEACFATALRALTIRIKPLDYICEAWAWGAAANDYAALSAWHLGLPDVALLHGLTAVDIDPTNPRLRENLAWYEQGQSPNPAGVPGYHDSEPTPEVHP